MDTLEEIERKAYERALTKTGGNRTHAAALLGVDVATVKRRIAKWKIANDYPSSPGRRSKRSKPRENSQSAKK